MPYAQYNTPAYSNGDIFSGIENWLGDINQRGIQGIENEFQSGTSGFYGYLGDATNYVKNSPVGSNVTGFFSNAENIILLGLGVVVLSYVMKYSAGK